MEVLTIISAVIVAIAMIAITVLLILYFHDDYRLSWPKAIGVVLIVAVIVLALLIMDYAFKTSLIKNGVPWWYVWLR